MSVDHSIDMVVDTSDDNVFIRKSMKYVVPNHEVERFVGLVTAVLPISPFTLPCGDVVDSQVNNSSYFDDDYLNQYKERVVKNDGAELYRVRWYGSDLNDVDSIFVERKTHRNYKQTGNYSNKKRFELPKDEMVRFLLGAPIEELNPSKVSLATSIQSVMMNMKPKVRTQYLRTSFMNEEDKALRVTLDRNIEVYSEPNTWQEVSRMNGLPSGQGDMMPFSVIEVKVNIQTGGSPVCPEWLEQTLLGVGARKIKLSKYGYGCMKLYPVHARPTPKWASEIQTWTNELAQSSAVYIEAPPSYKSDRSSSQESIGFVDFRAHRKTPSGAKRIPETLFQKARRHGKNRRKYGKTDGKAFMANERTYLNYIQWTSGLATFCVGLLQLASSKDLLYVTTAIILYCDILMIYASVIYHLRRIYFVGNVASRNGRVPIFFNEWRIISAIMLLFFGAVNSYMGYLWLKTPVNEVTTSIIA
eukprot:CFRG2636T1